MDDFKGGPLQRLEALEAMSIGIEGKRLMWAGMSIIVGSRPDLAETDFAGLERQAEAQQRKVETLRIEALVEAFSPSGQSE